MSEPMIVEPSSVKVRRARLGPWSTLVVTALGVAMVNVDGTAVGIANPAIAKDLGASLADLQWVMNGYLLAVAVLLIPAGNLGDRYGHRRIFLMGVAGFITASLAISVSSSIGLVVAFRALQGVFGAMIMPNTLALLRSAFPPSKLGSAMAVWAGVNGAASAAGPLLGGLLVEQFGWRSVFYINLPIGLLALVGGLLALSEGPHRRPRGMDLRGIVLLGAGLFLLVSGVINAQAWGWDSGRTLAGVGGGLATLTAFVIAEMRTDMPLLPLRLLRDRSVSIGSVSVLLAYFNLVGVLFFVPLYLQNVQGYRPLEVGLLMLPSTVAFMVASPISSRLSARFGPRVPVTAGMLILAGSIFAMLALQRGSSFHVLLWSTVGLGIGAGLVIVSASAAIVGHVPIEFTGLAGGLQSTFSQLGSVLSTAVLGSVLATWVSATLSGHLARADVPTPRIPSLLTTKDIISQGSAPVNPGMTDELAQAVTAGSHAAFMSGLHGALMVAAATALIGAAIAAFLLPGHREQEAAD